MRSERFLLCSLLAVLFPGVEIIAETAPTEVGLDMIEVTSIVSFNQRTLMVIGSPAWKNIRHW